jgi:hypothetical protein
LSSSPIPFGRRDWLALLVIWAAAIVMIYARGTPTGAVPFFGDTDDAMRLVMARDLLAGQGWYDLVQHRLNTPFGAEIHWSRLIDLPLAALLGLGQLFAAPAAAAVFAGTVWPLALLALLLWLSARATFELVGREGLLPALVLPVLSPAVMAEFNPGRIDHHNVIIVLSVAILLASLVALRRPLGAWLAGLLTATALAVAIEALPVAIAAILAFGLAYVVDPARAAALRRFGLAFAGGMVVHLALARPPARWLEAACDMISPVFVLAALAVCGSFTLVSLLPAPRRLWLRLLLLGGLGFASAALVVLVYPHCVGGPYGDLDPWLQRNWIAAIVEARPWHVSLVNLPSYTLVVSVPVVLGIVLGLFAFWRHPADRLGWLTLLTFILATSAVMFAQIRGARLAVLPVIPVAAWLVVSARHAYIARPRIMPALGVILALGVNAVIDLLPEGPARQSSAVRASKQPCLASQSFAELRAMPAARAMTPVDLGSHLLLETPHAVVAAPYHRNADGVLDAFRFFNRPVEEARAMAERRGLDLLVICEAMPEMQGAGLREPGTVLSLLAAGTPPDWIEPLSLEGPLETYRLSP